MDYFDGLPTILYTPDGSENSALMKNLFFKYVLTIEGIKLFQIYRIDGEKRLDQISYELYGTTSHWWILALINEIQDIIFDLPLNTETLHSIAKDYMAELELEDPDTSYYEEDGSFTIPGMTIYISKYEELEIENDKKRVIKVIRPDEIYKVLTLISNNI